MDQDEDVTPQEGVCVRSDAAAKPARHRRRWNGPRNTGGVPLLSGVRVFAPMRMVRRGGVPFRDPVISGNRG